MSQVRLKLSTAQLRILRSQTRGNLFLSGIGGGKSLTLARKAIEKTLQRKRGCIVSFSYVSLRDAMLQSIIEALEFLNMNPIVDYNYNVSDHIMNIKGTDLLLRTGDNPDRLRGPNLDFFMIDECREFADKTVYDIMLGRIRRSSDAQYYLATTTKGKNWIYDLIKKHDLYDSLISDNYAANEKFTVTRQTTLDAVRYKFIPRTYLEDLRSNYTTEFQSQELDCEFIESGGKVINSSWFGFCDYIKPISGVRAWDIAVSVKTAADYSAGALLFYSGNKICIGDMRHGKLMYPDLRRLIIDTAISDGTGIIIAMENAGQQLGFIDDLKTAPELKMHTIKATRVHGDKFNRVMPLASRAEGGHVVLCKAGWNRDFLDECDAFLSDMTHLHDDQLDSCAVAYSVLAQPVGYVEHRRLY